LTYSKQDEFMKAFVRIFGGVRPQPPKMPTGIRWSEGGCFMRRIKKHCALLGEDSWDNGCQRLCRISMK